MLICLSSLCVFPELTILFCEAATILFPISQNNQLHPAKTLRGAESFSVGQTYKISASFMEPKALFPFAQDPKILSLGQISPRKGSIS
jgi:hypothetical protein